MRIILASASPRRVELLSQFECPFEVIPSHIDEKHSDTETPEQVVMGLSYFKAYDIAKKNPDALVIASDTIVFNGQILGKPKSIDEAEQMLRDLSGKSHQVYSGLALMHLDKGKKIVSFEKTEVVFNLLEDAQIKRYVQKDYPLDKAGAYAIQGIGSLLVKEIQGDFFNIVGLPLSQLGKMLSQHFDIHLL